jgi:hypothetical protein
VGRLCSFQVNTCACTHMYLRTTSDGIVDICRPRVQEYEDMVLHIYFMPIKTHKKVIIELR